MLKSLRKRGQLFLKIPDYSLISLSYFFNGIVDATRFTDFTLYVFITFHPKCCPFTLMHLWHLSFIASKVLMMRALWSKPHPLTTFARNWFRFESFRLRGKNIRFRKVWRSSGHAKSPQLAYQKNGQEDNWWLHYSYLMALRLVATKHHHGWSPSLEIPVAWRSTCQWILLYPDFHTIWKKLNDSFMKKYVNARLKNV